MSSSSAERISHRAKGPSSVSTIVGDTDDGGRNRGYHPPVYPSKKERDREGSVSVATGYSTKGRVTYV